jgi:protein SCO1/2
MVNYLRRNTFIIVAAAVTAPLIAAVILLKMMTYGPDSSDTHRVTQVVGGSFTLLATTGQTVSPASWSGKLLVVAFGYRYCPDVCPTNLGTITSALDRLGPDGDRIQPLFITVDPERDTVEKLRDYVALFSPRLIGLTGTPAQIAEAARTFRIYYRKVAGATEDTYTMDHTAFFFISNDRGAVIKVFSHDTNAEQLASGLKELLLKPTS